MSKLIVLAYLLMLYVSFSAVAQKVSKTNFSLGICKTSPAVQSRYWDEPIPTYLNLGISKSLYSNNHLVSLRKEVG